MKTTKFVYIARSMTRRVMSVQLSVGSRLPAYCTSMGRVLLAALNKGELSAYLDRVELKPLTAKTIKSRKHLLTELDQVRKQGYALVDEELEMGLRSLAVPVCTSTGRVVAAMNTGVHAARASRKEMVNVFLPVLREGAKRLSYSLG